MLEIKNLHKEFNGIIAVNNLSLEIQEGEIFGLLGPNGAGKTTTIRCLLNIIQPDSGEILLNGSKNHDIKNIVGYLPEERGLYTKSRVIDVLLYLGELKGKSRKFLQERANYYMKKLEMQDVLHRRINELSKGNQQKIQLISSILFDPQILILDEPFSGLDPINQELIKDLIKEFLNEGKIIILSTHQMDLAEKLCNRIALINKGNLLLYGSLSDIKRNFGKMSLVVKSPDLDESIKNIPEFESIDLYENYAEINLKNHANTKEIIMKLLAKHNITGFELREPSLHSIFINTVKSSGNKDA